MTITSPVYAGAGPLSVWSDSRIWRPRHRIDPVIAAEWYEFAPPADEPAVVDKAADAAALVARLTAGDRGEW